MRVFQVELRVRGELKVEVVEAMRSTDAIRLVVKKYDLGGHTLEDLKVLEIK